jgi:ATP/maltotriose-dependent transcriptional regulator MalT
LLPYLPVETIVPPRSSRLLQARDLPKDYIPRAKTFEKTKHLLLQQRSESRINAIAMSTALRGAGGFGKTTLATALCHDSEIKAAFPDGILWVTLGEQPPQPLDLLNSLLNSLEEFRVGATTLEEAQDRWSIALQDRIYLLVIDDVWQTAPLKTLLEGGPQCIRLITTRND